MLSCYMKTITLTDEAYERLKDWKMGPRDSFPSVMLRLVPKRGTLFLCLPAMSLSSSVCQTWRS